LKKIFMKHENSSRYSKYKSWKILFE
jgi:hypothetical protein